MCRSCHWSVSYVRLFVGYFTTLSVRKGLLALRGYSTHSNERRPSQHMSRYQWLLRLGESCLGGQTNRCSEPSFFGEWFTSTLGTCASSSTATHAVHAWWGTNSLSAHCQTAPEPDFRWTVDRTRRASQLACTITWPQSSVGTPKDFGVFNADR
jgi:hypothetical protein